MGGEFGGIVDAELLWMWVRWNCTVLMPLACCPCPGGVSPQAASSRRTGPAGAGPVVRRTGHAPHLAAWPLPVRLAAASDRRPTPAMPAATATATATATPAVRAVRAGK